MKYCNPISMNRKDMARSLGAPKLAKGSKGRPHKRRRKGGRK